MNISQESVEESENTWRETQEQFRAMFDVSSVGMAVADHDGRFLRVNRALCEMTGYTQAELIGHAYASLTHPDDREADAVKISDFISGRITDYVAEKRYVRKDGSVLWVNVVANLVRDPAGQPVNTIAVIQDISARKQAEEKTREVMERYNHQVRLLEGFASTTPDWVYLFDLQARFLYANRSFLDVWGRSLPDILGKTCRALGCEPWLEELLQTDIAKAVESKQPVHREMSLTPPGAEKPGFYEFNFAPVLGHNNVVELVAGMAHDMTKRKVANEKLRESEYGFRVMANTVPAIVWTTDPEGRIEFLNRQCRMYAGLTDDPATANEFIATLIHPDDRALTAERFDEARRTGKTYQVEHRIRSASGEYRWFLVRGEPYRDPQTGRILHWFGASVDIHHRKLSEQALGKTRAALEEHADDLETIVAERTAKLRESLAQMETFSYTVSHDLRSPLRAMQAFAHLCLEEYGHLLDEKGRDYLKRIDTSAKRMDSLIQDVITYDKVARGDIQLERVDTQQLVEEVIQQYPSVNKPHAIFLIERPLQPVLASPAALVQALSNLLTNAVKFVGAGQKATVTIRTVKQDSTVRLYVEDNGIGIPPEALSNVFQPFHRAHTGAGYEGTGIGLAIVRKAVERMGGQIGVESEVGRGSKFWIELPAAS